MGAFGDFFGFDGRLDRLGYLWRSAVILIGVAALAWIATATVALMFRGGAAGGHVHWVIAGVSLLAFWANFALTTRRLRDIGWEPIHIMPAYAALWAINALLLEPMSRTDPARFGLVETAWIVMQWLAVIPLIFWPSPAGGGERPRIYDQPSPPGAPLDWRGHG